MAELRAENARLRRISEEEDRQLPIEIARRDADFRRVQALQNQIGELRRRRDERNIDPEDEGPSNDEN